MKFRKILYWVILLVITDQFLKVIINTYLLGHYSNIIPSILDFHPAFNIKHSYANVLLNKYFNVHIGLWAHVIFFVILELLILSIYDYFKNTIPYNTTILDIAIIFQLAAMTCALIGNLIWKQGTLDYLYLKPLFVFDLKDVFNCCFICLFLIYTYKNRTPINSLSLKGVLSHLLMRLNTNNK